MPAPEIDVLIHGAGPVGCTLALALRGTRLRVAVFDKTSLAPSFRPIALSYASRLILEPIGAWQTATPIETIHVSQAGGFGRARLEAGDAAVPALGNVMDYSTLAGSLRSQVEEFITKDAVAAKCAVHAEGAAPDTEEKRYAQDAVVALVHTDPPAHSAAFERFTPEGPLALLPFAGRYAMVWSRRPERARALADAPDAEFLAELGAAAGHRPGRPVKVEARAVQPLVLRVRAARIAPRAVFIGNAAQTLHPVAGQGLNLGLRDAWDLARVWRGSSDPGDAATLERYAARRRLDAAATIRVTDFLAGAFLRPDRFAGGARGAGPQRREPRKPRLRADHAGEPGPVSVQIAGADPALLADAARHNVERGADIIDINMGCPAKKVCNVAAGSALLEDEPRVARILEAVVAAVQVPVTLKIRTGPAPERRNALRIARIAESAGVQLLSIHGRTRACMFEGCAEYETIAEVKSRLRIPVIANGDVRTPEDAKRVLELTGADGIMVGRAAQGRPWLFREISHYLETGERLAPPPATEMGAILIEHLEGLYM